MERRSMIADSLDKVAGKAHGQNAWGANHVRTWEARGQLSHGQAIATMVHGLAVYADAYRRRFDSDISEDGVLGPAWREIGDGILALLNGELDGLDGGTVDGLIRRMGACSEP